MSERRLPLRTRHDEPQHWVRMTWTQTTVHADHVVPVDEAIESRIRRLREQGTKFVRAGDTLVFDDPNTGAATTLEYFTEKP